jgi:hypothetical protein
MHQLVTFGELSNDVDTNWQLQEMARRLYSDLKS